MKVPYKAETFLSMDIAEIQGWWLMFYQSERPMVDCYAETIVPYYTAAMAEFHARGIEDVCNVLEDAGFERDLEIEPFDKEIGLPAAKGMLTKMLKNKDYRIFSVEFIKRTDNEYRKMRCRFGVTKHLKGGVKKFDDVEKELKTVFDVEKVGYRSINLPEVIRMSIGGVKYIIEENKHLLARIPA